MTLYDIRLRVDVSSPQMAASLRDQFAEIGQSDDRVNVVNWDMGQVTSQFTVLAFDKDADESIKEVVEALNRDDARSQIETDTVAVVEVLDGPR